MKSVKTIGLTSLALSLYACSSSSSPSTMTENDAGGGHGDTGTTMHDAGDHTDGHKSTTEGGTGTKDTGTTTMSDTGTTTHDTGTTGHDTGTTTTPDGAKGETGGPSGPQTMLVTFGGDTTSQMVAVDVASKATLGSVTFTGFGITDARNASNPYLLEQNADIVTKLDGQKPWEADTSWQVRLTDGPDGGSYYSDPVQVVVQSGTNAYVLREFRNELAVINESATGDGGSPMTTVDLSSYVQAGDPDGVVEMTAGAYVASQNRLYVTLANFNELEATTYNTVICGSTTSTLVAIDTTNNSLVDLGGTGPHGAVTLTYFNPATVVYDAAGTRLLVVSAGCNAKPTTADGGVGAASGRGVEAVNLTTAHTASLLDLDTTSFPADFDPIPTGFVYIDSTHAVIGFDQTGQGVYTWNPTQTTLGALIPNAPDVFTYDGNGHLLGARLDAPEAGAAKEDLVSVAIPGGTSTTIASNVTTLTGAYVASVDVWPHP